MYGCISYGGYVDRWLQSNLAIAIQSGPYGPADQYIVVTKISLYKSRILVVNLVLGPVDLRDVPKFSASIVTVRFECS